MKMFFLIVLSILLFSCNNNKSEKIATAKAYFDKARADTTGSSFYYYNLSKNSYFEANDSIEGARSLVNMAIIQEGKGDYYGSIETSLEANRCLEKNEDSLSLRILASSFNNMAICSSYLYNFDETIEYYQKALQYSDDTENKYMYHNNLGAALITLEKYKEAQESIKLALPTKDSLKYAMFINNMARAKHYEDQKYNPLPEFNQALEIRQKKGEDENSSYAALSNYFFSLDKNKALYYANKMLNTAEKNHSPEDRLQALQKIINLDPEHYLVYFEKFQALNDSVQIARSKAKNQFATIRYDVEKKKNEIAENEAELLKRNIGLGALSVLLIGGFFWYKRRKKRLKQENELKIKNDQLRISKKVHDVVANGIYQVMTKIENQEYFDKEEALDELEFVYEKSRDISYEKPDLENDIKDNKDRISSLIASFKNDMTDTYIVGNENEIWNGISSSSFEDVYQVIRELLVNMKKHSQASRVIFKFERINNWVKIQYTDDGVGIPGEMIYKNGLTNTGTRIAAIRGEIIFDNKSEKGLKITISFPVS
ncbi:hypothetical protein NZD88_12860 [Chryseobacterium antibioticum]|uniref:histidine kinase n=1 Tax=Chryseobacterium pyrolae TaxID=2987481 RepID=A0ABT2IIF8_9FLAO|nr:tetratricopeptide repeat-containing sensor histidine kinase [Chryseobacterium pyrolae]MCT2408433.1 hypothetical protein [Chryseobacterium pyrolae]